MTAVARLFVVLVLTMATVMAGYLAVTASREPPDTLWMFWLVFALAVVSCVLGASKTLRSNRLRA